VVPTRFFTDEAEAIDWLIGPHPDADADAEQESEDESVIPSRTVT
jgi:hypothetical protein